MVSYEFEILPGWKATKIADQLAAQGLIRNAELFSLWLRYKGYDRSIGEGLYDLSPAMSAFEVAEELNEGGRPRVTTVVIPEGFRASDIVARLEGAGLGEAEAFTTLIQEPGELRPSYIPEEAGLEGHLFPATYEIPVHSTPAEALGLMLSRFELELTEEVKGMLEQQGLSVHEWVILASMVQSEAGKASEMPIIAGVFLNRLDQEMRLQSDPTVAYGLGKELPELDASEGDFTMEADHPWNTYTRAGLPAGPISNPGHAALQAVLHPQRLNDEGEPYLYFLHSRDGTIFRPNLTLEAHQQDVETYLRQAPQPASESSE